MDDPKYDNRRDDAVKPSRCQQWRLRHASDELQTRTWLVGANNGRLNPSDWVTVATGVINDISSDPAPEPPVVLVAGETALHRELKVDLRTKRSASPRAGHS